MADHVDVVIAGAGPAGAQCARDVARRGYRVVVLETEPEAGFPRQSNKSTGGTFPPMLTAFGIPDAVLMHVTDTVVLESPNEQFVQSQPGAVLEFADFKRFLVAEGRSHGAEYRFGARVNAPLVADGTVVGVRYGGDEKVFGEVVVDATGPAASQARPLGLSRLRRANQAVAIEYELDGVALDHPDFADLTDAMMLRLDHAIAPGGYAWIFHTGDATAKVGLTYVQNDAHRRYASEGLTIDDYLQRWLETDPRFADAERIVGKQHRGSAHLQLPGRMSTDRFMAIGDTVPTIDPLWGEGIHVGMRSGRAAATTIDGCLMPADHDTSAAAMAAYDARWHRDVAPDVRTRLLLSQLLYRASNDRYDRFLRDLRRLDAATVSDANAGRRRDLARLLHPGDLPLLARVLGDHLRRRARSRAGRT